MQTKSVWRSIFARKSGQLNHIDVTCQCTEQTIVCYALHLEFMFSNIHRSRHINWTCQLKFRKYVADSLIKVWCGEEWIDLAGVGTGSGLLWMW